VPCAGEASVRLGVACEATGTVVPCLGHDEWTVPLAWRQINRAKNASGSGADQRGANTGTGSLGGEDEGGRAKTAVGQEGRRGVDHGKDAGAGESRSTETWRLVGLVDGSETCLDPAEERQGERRGEGEGEDHAPGLGTRDGEGVRERNAWQIVSVVAQIAPGQFPDVPRGTAKGHRD
jgi:hypothetical protein